MDELNEAKRGQAETAVADDAESDDVMVFPRPVRKRIQVPLAGIRRAPFVFVDDGPTTPGVEAADDKSGP